MKNLESWNEFMMYASLGALAIGLITFLVHEARLLMIKDSKEKYDYINQHEITIFMRSALAYAISGALFINILASKIVVIEGSFGFGVRIFISACFFTVAYYFLSNLVKVYYPTYLEKKLNFLRHKPRVSPNGNYMRLLSEAEEDVHLDEGMQIEENFFTVDYDVWIDEKTGSKKVEKYMGFQHAEQCSECNYFTLKTDWERVITPPTFSESGEALRHYTCRYCEHKETREVHIAKLSTNVSITPQPLVSN